MSEKGPGNILNPEWIRKPEQESQDAASEAPTPDLRIVSHFRVNGTAAGSAAEIAGLRKGDLILSIDGQELPPGPGLSDQVQKSGDAAMNARVRSEDGTERDVALQPLLDETTGRWSLGLGYVPESALEGREGKVLFEIRNSEGRRIVAGYTELGPEEPSPGREKKGEKRREIAKYVLLIPHEDGSFEEYDLLRRFNPTGTKAYLDPSLRGEVGGHYDFTEKTVSAADIQGPLTPHLLLHELRHAYQYSVGMFTDIEFDYRSALEENYHDDATWTKKIKSESGLESIERILSHFYGEEDLQQLLKPFAEAWKTKIAASEKAWQDFNKNVTELKRILAELKSMEADVEIAKRGIFRNRLDPLLEVGTLQELRKRFEASTDQREALMSVGAFVDGADVQISTSDEAVRRAYDAVRLCFRSEGDLMPYFEWDQADLDPATRMLTLQRTNRQAGIRVSVPEQNIGKFEEANAAATAEFEEDRMQREGVLLERRKQTNERLLEAKKRMEEAEAAAPSADTVVVGSIKVRDVFRLPTLLIERDAEYGALVALRAIKRETGVDLLTQFYPEDGEPIPPAEPARGLPPRPHTTIHSLRAVYGYLDKIGVPRGCLTELKLQGGKARSSEIASSESA